MCYFLLFLQEFRLLFQISCRKKCYRGLLWSSSDFKVFILLFLLNSNIFNYVLDQSTVKFIKNAGAYYSMIILHWHCYLYRSCNLEVFRDCKIWFRLQYPNYRTLGKNGDRINPSACAK